MNKKIIAVAMLGVLIFSGVAHAQTSDLPDPGTLPGSPFYFVKDFFEGVGTFFTFGNSAKAERYLGLAEKRLVEAQALAEQDNERTQATIARYEEQYAKAKERAKRAENIDLEVRVTDATTKHLAVLDSILERVPEQTRESIRVTKERSVAGQLETLRGIAQQDPKAAVDIFARAAEGRLNTANARAGRGGDDEEKTEEVSETLAEYEKYAEFGKEISTLAEGLQTGETTVEELVERATSHHRDVLHDVESKVPSQARESIQRALDSAGQLEQLRPAVPAPANRDQSDTGPSETAPFPPQTEQGRQTGDAPGAGFKPEDVGRDGKNEVEIDNQVKERTYAPGTGHGETGEEGGLAPGTSADSPKNMVTDDEGGENDVVTKDMTIDKGPADSDNGGGGDGAICCKKIINGKSQYHWDPEDVCLNPESIAGIVVYDDFCLALGDAINEEDDVITEGVPEECASQGVYNKESCSEIMKKVPICCKHTINGEIKYEWTPGDICISPDRERVGEDLCSAL
jgi:hypothetical protein